MSRPTAVPPPLGGGIESTGTTPPAARTVAPPAAVPLPPVIGGPLVPPAPPAPAAPAAAPAAERAPARPLSLKLPDGSIVSVTAPLVLGRNPTADISPAGFSPIRVHDPNRSVSRAHVTLEPAKGELLLTDLGAANGTTLDHAGSRSRVTEASGRVPVRAGDRIWLGRVAIDVF
ncbi:FHA domain-containing protein [Salinibacterium sp. ZJ77]|uniref:FHA domain-containing protein n=1 Tax=Salinibacterium sp. ZJ77 TaxID=2708337 RepID=UPI001423B0CC|nr:FHA domain-containing protein [Salinibacterium sp. ZJ77]